MIQRTAFYADTPVQALLLEPALLLARQLQSTADAAPDGQVLARVEALAVPAARELARQAVQATLQTQADAAEKKGQSIGSGMVEGACKQVIGRRMKQTGALAHPPSQPHGDPLLYLP